jgi:tetratricopeptide (TPR) repeat protein
VARGPSQSPIDASAKRMVLQFTHPNSPELSNDDRCLLAKAYNQLGENKKAFDAFLPIPEEYLSAKHKLGAKRIYYHNLVFNTEASEHFVGYLAFVQRCIDNEYANKRVWLIWKASILCRTSVKRTGESGSGNPRYQIVDRNQYEQAYEILKKALAIPPKKDVDIDMFEPRIDLPNHFPVMHEEPRFERLFGT